MSDMSDFKRENRYVVFKISDVEKLNAIEKKALLKIGQSIDEIRQARGKTGFEAVVIESDWPEYEPVWDMLQDRMTGVEKTPNPERAKQSMQGEPLRINLGDGKHGVHYGTIEELPCLTISTKGVGEVGKPTTHKNNTEMELESEVMSVTFANHKSYMVFKNIVDSIPIYSDNTHAPDSAARIAEQDAEIAKLTADLEEARKDAVRYIRIRKIAAQHSGKPEKEFDREIDASLNIKGGAE